VANANKLSSTVYFFFGVFLGLTALVFFGDLVAFFAGLAAGSFPPFFLFAFVAKFIFLLSDIMATADFLLKHSFYVTDIQYYVMLSVIKT
jgi:membrane protein YqaA with SNARE-associated domain